MNNCKNAVRALVPTVFTLPPALSQTEAELLTPSSTSVQKNAQTKSAWAREKSEMLLLRHHRQSGGEGGARFPPRRSHRLARPLHHVQAPRTSPRLPLAHLHLSGRARPGRHAARAAVAAPVEPGEEAAASPLTQRVLTLHPRYTAGQQASAAAAAVGVCLDHRHGLSRGHFRRPPCKNPGAHALWIRHRVASAAQHQHLVCRGTEGDAMSAFCRTAGVALPSLPPSFVCMALFIDAALVLDELRGRAALDQREAVDSSSGEVGVAMPVRKNGTSQPRSCACPVGVCALRFQGMVCSAVRCSMQQGRERSGVCEVDEVHRMVHDGTHTSCEDNHHEQRRSRPLLPLGSAAMSAPSPCLQFVQRVTNAFLRHGGHDATVLSSLHIHTARPGYILGHMTVERHNVNRLNTLHGGVICSLTDTLGSLALASKGLYSTGVSTDIHTTFVKPANVGDKVTVEGRVVSMGERRRMEA